MFPSVPGTAVHVVLGLLSIWSIFLSEKTPPPGRVLSNFLLNQNVHCPFFMTLRNVLVFLQVERLELFELFLNPIVNIFLESNLGVELKGSSLNVYLPFLYWLLIVAGFDKEDF